MHKGLSIAQLFVLPALDQDQQTYQPLSGMAWEEMLSCYRVREWLSISDSGRTQWVRYYQWLLDWWLHYKAVEEGIAVLSYALSSIEYATSLFV